MQRLSASPVGRLTPIDQGGFAFIPNPLPVEVPLDAGLIVALDRAARAVGMIAGVGETIPNPHLLIRPFMRREAVLSSQIEGTIASLSDVAASETQTRPAKDSDVTEVYNYVAALEHGIERLAALPISFRLVNEIHERLMRGVRGQEPRPGEFRDTQVIIGAPASRIQDARFIPPPASHVRDLFLDLERFINDDNDRMPPLIRCALMHYQFEAIHPYRDGNGRTGRLLITLYLLQSGVLPEPLLYLSAYFERDRQRYYDELLNVSVTGDWAPWIDYFLTGVETEARDTVERIRRVRGLQEGWRDLLRSRGESANGLRLLDELCASLVTTAPQASTFLGITDAGARRVLDRLVDAGIVRRLTNNRPNLYIAQRLIQEIERPIALKQD